MCSVIEAAPSSSQTTPAEAHRAFGLFDALEIVRDDDEPVTVVERRLGPRVQFETSVMASDPDRSGVLEHADHVVEPCAVELWAVGDVEVATPEVHELVDDLAEASLAERKRPDPRDRLGGDDGMHRRATGVDQASSCDRIGDFDDDGEVMEAAEFGNEREHGLGHGDVVALVLGEYDDAPRIVDVGQREVGPNPRVTEPVDDAGSALIGDGVDHGASKLGGVGL